MSDSKAFFEKLQKLGIEQYFPVLHAGLFIYDLKTSCIQASTGYAEYVLGYSSDEIIQPGFYPAIVHPHDWKNFKHFEQQCANLKKNELRQSICRFRKKDGKYVWVNFRVMPFEWDTNIGEVISVIGSGMEVSDKVKFNKELQKKNKLLEDISYMNAHEVRAPVASILGLIQFFSVKSFNSEIDKEIFMRLKDTVAELESIIYKISRHTEK